MVSSLLCYTRKVTNHKPKLHPGNTLKTSRENVLWTSQSGSLYVMLKDVFYQRPEDVLYWRLQDVECSLHCSVQRTSPFSLICNVKWRHPTDVLSTSPADTRRTSSHDLICHSTGHVLTTSLPRTSFSYALKMYLHGSISKVEKRPRNMDFCIMS